MPRKEGYTPKYPNERSDRPPIVEEIHQRLGELGIREYTRLPRKQKKAAKKLALGKQLSQRELARLAAISRSKETS